MRRVFAIHVGVLALAFPSMAFAVPTLPERVTAALMEQRYADALALVVELDRVAPSLWSRWARATALLFSARAAEAVTVAGACESEAATSTEEYAATVRGQCAEIRRRAEDAVRRATPAPAPTPAAPAAPPRPAGAPPVRVVQVPERPAPSEASVPTGAVVLLSAGAVSLATAAVFYGLARGALAPCNVTGDVATCAHTDDLAHARAAPDYTTGANVALGVGGALALGGAAWWVVGALTRRPAGTSGVTVTVGADGSVGVVGRF